MGQEQRATSGAAVTVIVVIAVIAILLFLGLLVLGLGAFFFVRTEARQVQQAEVMQMEAMAQLEKAKAESERVRATQAQMPLESAAAASIVVTIDAQSQLSVDGQMVMRDELRERISADLRFCAKRRDFGGRSQDRGRRDSPLQSGSRHPVAVPRIGHPTGRGPCCGTRGSYGPRCDRILKRSTARRWEAYNHN